MAWLRLLSPQHWADRRRALRQRATSAPHATNGGTQTKLLLRKKR